MTLSVRADGTPPYTYQWSRDGQAIDGATGFSFTLTGVGVADDGARFAVEVTGADGSASSDEGVLTVIPATEPPAILGAKGLSNRTEVVVTFSEPMDPTSAGAGANYSINGGDLNVSDAVVSPSGKVVTLTTDEQSLGTKYTILINGSCGSEAATRLEYDITFEQTEIYRVWYRASGDNGNDDSGWRYRTTIS